MYWVSPGRIRRLWRLCPSPRCLDRYSVVARARGRVAIGRTRGGLLLEVTLIPAVSGAARHESPMPPCLRGQKEGALRALVVDVELRVQGVRRSRREGRTAMSTKP